MIEIRRVGAGYVPLVYCDQCSGVLDNVGLGVLVYSISSPERYGTEWAVRYYAHKGACHDELARTLTSEGHVVAWEELRKHLGDLIWNLGGRGLRWKQSTASSVDGG